MSEISVARAELYDAGVQYVVGKTYWDGMGDQREASRACQTIFCKSIEFTYTVADIVKLKVVLEKTNENYDIVYKGKFFIVREDNGNDQTRR